jgi:TolA-binding protein
VIFLLRQEMVLLFVCSALFFTQLQGSEPFGRPDSSRDLVDVRSSSDTAVLHRRIGQLEERIDGLTSLVEGQNALIGELQASVASGSQAAKLRILEDRIAALEACCQAKRLTAPATDQKGRSDKLGEQSPSRLYTQGVRLFGKQQYDAAKVRFEITQAKGYKPAASNYYLGEIAYYTKHYEDAIFYFKKSAGLYDKASYLDVLLLHTAISLERTGDTEQARRFYRTVIESYPDRKSARIAKKNLKLMR